MVNLRAKLRIGAKADANAKQANKTRITAFIVDLNRVNHRVDDDLYCIK